MLQELGQEERLVRDKYVRSIDIRIAFVEARETGSLSCDSLLVNPARGVVQFDVANRMGISVSRLEAREVAQARPKEGLQRVIARMSLTCERVDGAKVRCRTQCSWSASLRECRLQPCGLCNGIFLLLGSKVYAGIANVTDFQSSVSIEFTLGVTLESVRFTPSATKAATASWQG